MPTRNASPARRLWLLFVTAMLAVGLVVVVRALALGIGLFRPIPFWDHWEFIKSIPRLYGGSYSLHDLFDQHNEHRIMTARVVFILDLLLCDGTGQLSTLVIYLTLLAIAAVMAAVTTRGKALRASIFLIVFGFLISAAEWENLSSGFQVQFPFVDLFIIASIGFLVLALDGDRMRGRLAYLTAASIFDFLAVFSMASGVLAIVPAAFVGLIIRPKSKMLMAYGVMHVAFCGLFFFGYVKPTYIAATYDPIVLVYYVLVYLGAGLRGYWEAPVILGLLDAALVAYGLARTARRAWRADARVDRAQVFALAIALLIVAGAFVTANGRASLGVLSALSSRYALQSILLQICLFVYLWRATDRSTIFTPSLLVMRGGLIALMLSFSLLANFSKLSINEWRERVASYDNAGYAFVNGVFSDDMVKLVYPSPKLVREPIRFLIDHRLSLFSPRFDNGFLPPDYALAGLDHGTLRDCIARFGTKRVGSTWLQLDGWVFDKAKPASDGWILVLDREDHDRIVGFGRQSMSRPDVEKALKVTADRTGFIVGANSPRFGDGSGPSLTIVLIPRDPMQPACQATMPPEPNG